MKKKRLQSFAKWFIVILLAMTFFSVGLPTGINALSTGAGFTSWLYAFLKEAATPPMSPILAGFSALMALWGSSAVKPGAYSTLSSEEEAEDDWSSHSSATVYVNPATGLPMIGGIGGFDAGGNPYGMDNHHH